GPVGGTEVLKVATFAQRVGREADQPARAETVVQIFIPLVTDCAGADGGDLTRRLGRDRRIAPEAELAHRFWRLDRVKRRTVHSKDCAYHRVFRASAVGGRAESRIAPRAGPNIRQRVDLGVRVSFLVAHQSPELGSRSVDAVLPASFPEHYVSTEKRQVDARVAGAFHVGPLGS